MSDRTLDRESRYELRCAACPHCAWSFGWAGPPGPNRPEQEALQAHLRERHPEKLEPEPKTPKS